MKPTCSERQGRTRTILRTLLHVWKLALCTQTSGIVAEASCVEEDAAGLCTRTSPEAVQDTRLPGDQVDSAWVVPLHSGGMNRVQMKQCLSALSLTRHWRKNYAATAPSAELMMSMEPLALATASVSAACGCSGGAALTAMAVTPRPLSGSPLGGDWI